MCNLVIILKYEKSKKEIAMRKNKTFLEIFLKMQTLKERILKGFVRSLYFFDKPQMQEFKCFILSW